MIVLVIIFSVFILLAAEWIGFKAGYVEGWDDCSALTKEEEKR